MNLYSNENRDSCLRILHCLYQRMQSCRLHLANIKCLARSAVPISSQKSSQSVYGQKVLRAPQPPLRSRYRQVAPRRRHMSLSAALWPTATVTWRGCAARRTEIRSCGNCHGNEWEPVTTVNPNKDNIHCMRHETCFHEFRSIGLIVIPIPLYINVSTFIL